MPENPGPCIEHLTGVGKTKAMGLLCCTEIRALGHNPYKLAQHFNTRAGFMVRHFSAGDEMWGDIVTPAEEALAIGHHPSLQRLIDGNKNIVLRAGWPDCAAAFFEKSFHTFVFRGEDRDQSALQALIKTAYDHPYAGEGPLLHARRF